MFPNNPQFPPKTNFDNIFTTLLMKANILLQNPQQYTGHCFRRSASTCWQTKESLRSISNVLEVGALTVSHKDM
jgi:hypothetical protein